MKYQQSLFVLLILIFLVVGLFGNIVKAQNEYILNQETKDNNVIIATKHAELYIKEDYISKQEKYIIAQKIEKGIRDLKNYLGKYNKYNFQKEGKIEYYIENHHTIKSGAVRSNGRIHLSHVHLQKSPYIHETAHILLDENSEEVPDFWLREGLPTYLNAKLAEYKPEIIGDNNNLEKRTQQYLHNKDYEVLVETFPTPYFDGANGQRAFYWLSGSFVKYIEDNYGKEKLLKLYNARRKKSSTITALEDDSSENSEATSKSTEDILGTSIDELKEKWLANVQS
jgi:hypothetical protein